MFALLVKLIDAGYGWLPQVAHSAIPLVGCDLFDAKRVATLLWSRPGRSAMESQEGHNPDLDWRGKSAKPYGIRTDSVRFPYSLARIPYGIRTVLND